MNRRSMLARDPRAAARASRTSPPSAADEAEALRQVENLPLGPAARESLAPAVPKPSARPLPLRLSPLLPSNRLRFPLRDAPNHSRSSQGTPEQTSSPSVRNGARPLPADLRISIH